MLEGGSAKPADPASSPRAHWHAHSACSSSLESRSQHRINWREAAELATAAYQAQGPRSYRAAASCCMSPDVCSTWQSAGSPWCRDGHLGGRSDYFSSPIPASTGHAGDGASSSRPYPSPMLRSSSASLCPTSPLVNQEAAAGGWSGAPTSLLRLLAEQHLVIRAYQDHVQQLEAAAPTPTLALGPAAGCRAGGVEGDLEPSLGPGSRQAQGVSEAEKIDSDQQGAGFDTRRGLGMGKCCPSRPSPHCHSYGDDGAYQSRRSLCRELPEPGACLQSDALRDGSVSAQGRADRPASPQLCGASLRQRSTEVEGQLAALLAQERLPLEHRAAARLLGQLADPAQLDQQPQHHQQQGAAAADLPCCSLGGLDLQRQHVLLQGQHVKLQQVHAELGEEHAALQQQLASSRERCTQLLQQLEQAKRQQQQQQAGCVESGSQQLGEAQEQDHVRQPQGAAEDPGQLGEAGRRQYRTPAPQQPGLLRRRSNGSDLERLQAQELPGMHDHVCEQHEGLCPPCASKPPGRRRLYSCSGWEEREDGCKPWPRAALNPGSTDQVLLRAQATRALHAEAFAEEHQMVAEATQQLELLRQLVEELRAECNDTKQQLRACQQELEVARGAAGAGRDSCSAAAAAAAVADVRQREADASAALARLEEEKLLLLARVTGLQRESAESHAAAAAAQLEVQQQLESQRLELEGKMAAVTERVVKERQQLQARLRLSIMIGHGKQRAGA